MLSLDLRERIVDKAKEGLSFSKVAELFETTRQTVSKWFHRSEDGEGLEDRSRRPDEIQRKVKETHERAIGILRDAFNWGTSRLQSALARLPEGIKSLLQKFDVEIDPIHLSRTTINKVLKKLGLNGSPYHAKHEYDRFEMTESNELWQLDIKGPFRLEYEEHYAIFGLDDHSRFLVCTELMESTPTTEDVKSVLRKSFEEYGKPERVLVDRGPQFREEFKEFCEEEGIKVEQAPPHYPQIKGKIERFIRNFNEEYLVLQRVFTGVKEHFPKWVRDYNFERPHMGIDNMVPADRYEPVKD